MTFTYDTTDAVFLATDLGKVRRKIGDTNEPKALLTDEEIAQLLVEHPDVQNAAIEGVRNIIAELARDVDRSNLGMSATRTAQITHFELLLTKLEAEASTSATPFVGGISESRKDTLASDTDFTQPLFERERNTIRRGRDRDDTGSF